MNQPKQFFLKESDYVFLYNIKTPHNIDQIKARIYTNNQNDVWWQLRNKR